MSIGRKTDYTGKTFGDLLVLSQKWERGKSYCYCQCLLCSKLFWTRKDSIASGRTASCGCRTKYKSVDITGKAFNYLKAIRLDHKAKGVEFWLFECLRCGNQKVMEKSLVVGGRAKSCGCLKASSESKEGGIKALKEYQKNNLTGTGTKRDAYESDQPLCTNKLNVRGVCFDKRRNKYLAQIVFCGKRHFLGRYKTIEEAKKAYDLSREMLVNHSGIEEIKAVLASINADKEYISIKEYCLKHGYTSRAGIRKRLRDGKLEGKKVSGRWLIKDSDD